MENSPSKRVIAVTNNVASSFTPWTAPLGGVTPCYSTLPPERTSAVASKVVQPRETKPTVTISGTVFALQYSVLTDGQKLSAGVLAGIVIGVAVIIGCMLWAVKLLRRKARKSRGLKEELQGGSDQPPQQNAPVPPSPTPPATVILPPPPPAEEADHLASPPKNIPVRRPTVRRHRGDRPRRHSRPDPIPEGKEPSPKMPLTEPAAEIPQTQLSHTRTGLYRTPTTRHPPAETSSSAIRNPSRSRPPSPSNPLPPRHRTPKRQRERERNPAAGPSHSRSRTPIEFYREPDIPSWLAARIPESVTSSLTPSAGSSNNNPQQQGGLSRTKTRAGTTRRGRGSPPLDSRQQTVVVGGRGRGRRGSPSAGVMQGESSGRREESRGGGSRVEREGRRVVG